MPYWFPISAHPDRGSRLPWYFSSSGGLVFPARGYPLGPTQQPWFRIWGGWAYPLADHPSGASLDPWFELYGSFAYSARGNPVYPVIGPLYQLRGPNTALPWHTLRGGPRIPAALTRALETHVRPSLRTARRRTASTTRTIRSRWTAQDRVAADQPFGAPVVLTRRSDYGPVRASLVITT